jgi:hypothetical protein
MKVLKNTDIIMSYIFWDIRPCNPLKVKQSCRLLLGIFFDPEDGGDMFLQNVGCPSMDYTALYIRSDNSL